MQQTLIPTPKGSPRLPMCLSTSLLVACKSWKEKKAVTPRKTMSHVTHYSHLHKKVQVEGLQNFVCKSLTMAELWLLWVTHVTEFLPLDMQKHGQIASKKPITWESVQYPLFDLQIDAYRFGVLRRAIKLLKVRRICYEMAMQAIAHANHIHSGCPMAHSNPLFDAQTAM